MTPPQSFTRHTPGPVRLMGTQIWTEPGTNAHCIAEVLGRNLVGIEPEEAMATAQFLASAWDMEVFLKLLDNGGSIVSSNDCSSAEIVVARACHRFFVDQDGFGYVYRPKKPVTTTEAEQVKHDEPARTLTEAGKDVPTYGSPEWLEAYKSMGGA